jgi:carbon-monoxide dehydrogenase medium subunit
MKAAPFTYHRPESLDEALGLLAGMAEAGEEGKVLAGGQSLLPVMALRLAAPAHLVDIGRLPDLDRIIAGPSGVRIGAMVRHAQAERSEDLARWAPMVHQAMPWIGHRAIRTRGTVVGSIAHADPAAEMPAVCAALGATMHVASTSGERTVSAAEFFTGYLTTALEEHEILTAVEFPAWSDSAGSAVVELSRRHGDYALLGLACGLQVDDSTGSDGSIVAAALVFFGAGPTPVRITEAEDVLLGRLPTPETFAVAAEVVCDIIDPTGDVHATAAYRQHIAGVLTRRGLAEAASRIGGASE